MHDENNQGAINKFLSQFTRKELLAWFIILDLVILIIGISTWKFALAKEVVDQIGLASSLASIIMAALAIIYAFFQTNASTEQNTLLQLNVQKIGEQVYALSGISAEIAQFRNIFDERIQIINNIQNEFSQNHKDINQVIADLTASVENLNPTGNNEGLIKKLHKEIERLNKLNSQQNQNVSENLFKATSEFGGALKVVRNEFPSTIEFIIKLGDGITIGDAELEILKLLPFLSRANIHTQSSGGNTFSIIIRGAGKHEYIKHRITDAKSFQVMGYH